MDSPKNIIPKVEPIAVIGMSCFFPQSPDLKGYWRLLFQGKDAITEIPSSHWSIEDYFDSDPKKPDHVYCKRGGFLDPVSLDPMAFGIPPATLEATDSSQLLGVLAAKAALEHAGYATDADFDRSTVSVILGVTGTQELVIPLSSRLGHPIWRKALASSGVDPHTTEKVIGKISDAYVSWQESSFPGLLGNVVAGRISNRLDLGGTNSVVDAACASSHSALHTAVMELASGRSSMVVAGGVDTLNDIFMHMCFSKTGVLSPTGDAKPFSKDADGTVLGEGIGIVILKRLNDAKRDKDTIYAVIKAIGSSSDGKSQSIYAPRAEGQIKALKRAYALADVDPATVDLLEAHGTGTRVGDEVEFNALNTFLMESAKEQGKTPAPCALGSVKSMIGHTKAAAGSAGLIKSILALYHKVLPPTLKATEPDPNLNIHNSLLYLNTESRPWFSNHENPRRAGVSAFGFGGSNFHAVLEEYQKNKKDISWDGSVEILPLCASSPKDLAAALVSTKSQLENEATFQNLSRICAMKRSEFKHTDPYRLVIIIDRSAWENDNGQTFFALFDDTLKAVNVDPDNPSIDSKSVFFGGPKKPGKIAFVFPGQGAQYVGMGKDLVCTFPQAFEVVEKANRIFEKKKPLSDFIYPIPVTDRKEKKNQEAELTRTDNAQPAIGSISLGMSKVLDHFGMAPDAACGHSFGELVALNAAGWIDDETLLTFAVNRGKLMAAAGNSGDKDPGTMTAVKAPLEAIDEMLKNSDTGVILANRNNPEQGVLSGPTKAIEKAEQLCKEHKFKTIRLTVAAAFHSHLMKDAQKPFMDLVMDSDMSSTQIPVYSNTTGTPYPTDVVKAKTLLGEQILCPVDFVNDIKNLFQSGVETFVEVGPKTVLTGLIKAILKDETFNIIPIDGSGGRKSGILDLALALGQLASLGYPVLLDKWEQGSGGPETPEKPKMEVKISGNNYRSEKTTGSSSKDSKKTTNRLADKPETMSHQASSPKPVDSFHKPVGGDFRDQHQPIRVKASQHTPSMSEANRSSFEASPSPDPSRPVSPSSSFAALALQTVQEGLKSMQALQQQTAQTHQKFLESQMESNKTLQKMIDSTQHLVSAAMGIHSNVPAPRLETSLDTTPRPLTEISQVSSMAHTSQTPDIPKVSTPSNESSPIQDFTIPEVDIPDLSQSSVEVQNILLETVSELTGYPIEMLGLDMDIEADLGIDSIKRVEILSTMEEKIPGLPQVEPEMMGSLKTLNQIIAFLSSQNADTFSSSAPASSDPNSEPHNTDVSAILLETVSELTGYPVEMLGLDMDIEADLGIDSIKRVEILSTMEEKIPGLPQVEPEMMGSLKTLNQIIAFLSSSGTVDSADSSDPFSANASEKLSADAAKENLQPSDERPQLLNRQVLSLVPKNAEIETSIHLPPKKKVYVLDDATGLSEAIIDEFHTRNIKTKLATIDTLLNIGEIKDASGLVILPEEKYLRSEHVWHPENSAFLSRALLLAAKFAPTLKASADMGGALFATITQLDGAFGLIGTGIKNPVMGSLAGLTKTASLEWKGVTCRAIDLPSDASSDRETAAVIVDELLCDASNGPIEVALSHDNRYEIRCINEEMTKTESIDFSEKDVLVITGGARGVTAASALALAQKYHPTLVLLGRSPAPFSEPEWLKDIVPEPEMKRAILENEFAGKKVSPVTLGKRYKAYLANREIIRNLDAITATGAKAIYMSADIRNADEVTAALEQINTAYGPISALIHGAGVLEDHLIVDKTAEQFVSVFETKVKGLYNLLASPHTKRLKYLILFSSVAARTGNKGQVDYAMANEALNKIGQQEKFNRPECRVISINWGPWDGGMVNPVLKKEFFKNNIGLIPLASGAQSLIAEMENASPDHVEIVIGSTMLGITDKKINVTNNSHLKQIKQRSLSLVFERLIHLNEYPVLKSHMLDGNPVVPFALMAEWFGHAALHENPGLVFLGLDDMRVLNGIKIDQQGQHIRLLTGKIEKLGNNYCLDIEIRSDGFNKHETTHAKAKAILGENQEASPLFKGPSFMGTNGYARSIDSVYNDILFHGIDLQGITSINTLTPEGMVAEISPAPSPVKWMKNPMRNRWIGDPLVLDSAFQMASLWCFEEIGHVSLPVYSAAYRQYRPHFPKESITAVLEITKKSTHKMNGDFTFLDDQNEVVARLTGFESILDESLMKAFKPQYETKRKAS